MSRKEKGPILRRELLILENGVDFKNGYHGPHGSKSVDYENFCFQSITDELNLGSFAIGPHFIDELFNVNYLTVPGISIPDTIVFNTNDLDSWKIKELYEFKSGKGNGIDDKLDGFSKLLNQLRQHKNFLPFLLKEHLGEQMPVPSEIIVPPDSKVKAVIVKPKLSGIETISVNTKFPVEHRKITSSPSNSF